MEYEFTYNGQGIKYEIIRKPVKNINIRVKPDGSVMVSCNQTVTNQLIELIMIKKARWILETIEKYKVNLIEFKPQNLRLVDGESFLLLGKVLRIQNIESDEFKVEYDHNYLYVHRPNKLGVKQKFNDWYAKITLDTFKEITEQCYEKYKKYNISSPTVIYKNMKTRWGTCNVDKKVITLNSQLIKVDRFLIEYVIYHELTHLLYRNHSKNFYSFLNAMVPDWKEREEILNKIFINEINGGI